MSKLKKAIERVGRRESGPIGFGSVAQSTRRAMLLAAVVHDAKQAKDAIAAGVNAVIIDAGSASDAAKVLGQVEAAKAPVGALLGRLDTAAAAALAEAKCDFVVSPLATTEASAVDTNRLGHIVIVEAGVDDATLRALGTLGLDAVAVDMADGATSLADHLGRVRVAQMAATPLVVRLTRAATTGELRALRDGGAAVVAAPAGASAAVLADLASALEQVPEPRRREGRSPEIALLPSLLGAGHEHDDDGDEPDDDD